MSDGNTEATENTGPSWRIEDWFEGLEQQQLEQLKGFHAELMRFNAKMNLISTQTEQSADLVHFADCIFATSFLYSATEAQEIYDIGSGNGLPGLVLAIFDPSRKIICVDKDQRKAEFIRHTAAKIGLTNVECLAKRAEELEHGTVNCAISRGFASIGNSILSLRKAIPKGAEYYHMKSDSWPSELAKIASQSLAQWEPSLVADYQLPITGAKFSLVKTKKLV